MRAPTPGQQLVILGAVLALFATRPAGAIDVVPKPAGTPQRASGRDSSGTRGDEVLPPEVVPPPPAAMALPIVLDSGDLGLGATVYLGHMPDALELRDLSYVPELTHIVVSLAAWPGGYEDLQSFVQGTLPEGADVLVFVSGYPPSNAAAEAWNYVRGKVRIFVIVPGPPDERIAIDRLNSIRRLERVVDDTDRPSRSGFERLQHPLSYRVVRR